MFGQEILSGGVREKDKKTLREASYEEKQSFAGSHLDDWIDLI